MNIEQQIEALKSDFNSKLDDLKKQLADNPKDGLKEIEALKNEKPKFEVGKYYRIHYTGQHCYGLPYEEKPFYIVRFNRHEKTNSGDRVIFDHSTWKDKEIMFALTSMSWFEREATPSEVEQHLIEEAKKRGYKLGCKLKSLLGSSNVIDDKSLAEYCYDVNFDDLQMHGTRIYKNGLWAEIIKEDKILIGGYEVVIHPRAKETSIDGNIFKWQFWDCAKVVAEHSKAKIMVGCSKQFDVSLEQINQILDKLK